MADLGPATERLLERVFADEALIPACSAAKVLGMDEKTLRETVESGLIKYVIVGAKTRRYAEADIRAYLAGGQAHAVEKETAPCQSTSRRSRASSTSISSKTVVDFMDLRVAKRGARPNR